jgi:hypothetical protein
MTAPPFSFNKNTARANNRNTARANNRNTARANNRIAPTHVYRICMGTAITPN